MVALPPQSDNPGRYQLSEEFGRSRGVVWRFWIDGVIGLRWGRIIAHRFRRFSAVRQRNPLTPSIQRQEELAVVPKTQSEYLVPPNTPIGPYAEIVVKVASASSSPPP